MAATNQTCCLSITQRIHHVVLHYMILALQQPLATLQGATSNTATHKKEGSDCIPGRRMRSTRLRLPRWHLMMFQLGSWCKLGSLVTHCMSPAGSPRQSRLVC